MNASQRTRLLKRIDELSRRYPDWRLGQLVCNVAGWADADTWDAEDEQLLAAAEAHLDQSTKKPASRSPRRGRKTVVSRTA
ncbi:MAG: hypothetical protein ACKV2Q_26840 [Planctomycetaceae bacterium]